MSNSEGLQPADWSLVPNILKILETDSPDSRPPCGYLQFYASCRTSLDAVLLTPGGKVDKYGTFVLYVYGHNYGTFYSLLNCKEMKSLLATAAIPWNEKPIWGPIHEKFQPALDELYVEKNLKLRGGMFIGNTYAVDINEAKKITYTCPPDVYLGPLKEEQGELIDSFWPHRGGNSVDVTKFIIKRNGGVGLYLKETNELIAWCLIWAHNGPGQLYVIDKYKRKGYGMLVSQALTKSLAEKGILPMLFIVHSNIASQELFKKIGYRKLFGIRWSSAEPKE